MSNAGFEFDDEAEETKKIPNNIQSPDLDRVQSINKKNLIELYRKDKWTEKDSINQALSNRSNHNNYPVNSRELDAIINLNEKKPEFYVNNQSDEAVVLVLDEDKQDEETRKGSFFNKLTASLSKKDDTLGYLKMYQRTNRVSMNTIGDDQLWRLKVFIDGPYGTPSAEIFEADHAVLIASGIGITPFASILQSLMHRYRQARATCPNCKHKLDPELICNGQKLGVKKVDFIWITREQRSLEWFISILSQMEIEQKKNNELFLETHLYVTSAKRQSDLKSIALHLTMDAILSHEDSNLVDGLRQRTHPGRPNWDILLQNLIRKQKGKITVFYCGLQSLANVLQEKCREYNLIFKKEVF